MARAACDASASVPAFFLSSPPFPHRATGMRVPACAGHAARRAEAAPQTPVGSPSPIRASPATAAHPTTSAWVAAAPSAGAEEAAEEAAGAAPSVPVAHRAQTPARPASAWEPAALVEATAVEVAEDPHEGGARAHHRRWS